MIYCIDIKEKSDILNSGFIQQLLQNFPTINFVLNFILKTDFIQNLSFSVYNQILGGNL